MRPNVSVDCELASPVLVAGAVRETRSQRLVLLTPFLVKNIFTDFKRHDLGTNFYERNYDGRLQTQFLTRPLWGIGSTEPYGHDGAAIPLTT
jgi:CxxC motif-containing protein (DUF1111 family)